MPKTASLIARRIGRRVAVLGVATVAVASFAGPAAAKQPKDGPSAPTLSVSQTSLPGDRASTVTVTGGDYLVPDHPDGGQVFGGVYVFFGWVSGSGWGPSYRNSNNNNGTFGVTYSYPGDNGGADTRDDGTGVIRLVSFTPGGESGSATSFHMDGAGNWQTELVINGSTYSWKSNLNGAVQNVDCRTVQCGVFTVGAHGKSSRTNEQFVPITFSGAEPPPSNTQPPQVTTPGGGGGSNGGGGGATGGGTATTVNPGGNTPTPPSGGASTGAGATATTPAPTVTNADGTTATAAPTTTVAPVDKEAAAAAAERALEAELAASDRDASESIPVGLLVALAVVVGLIALGSGGLIWRKKHRVSPEA